MSQNEGVPFTLPIGTIYLKDYKIEFKSIVIQIPNFSLQFCRLFINKAK